MRFVFFLIVVFLAVSCVYCKYFDAERDEALRDSDVPHEKAEDGDETEKQLEDAKNVDDKPNLKKVIQRLGNEKRGFRSYFYNYLDEMAMSICATIPSPRGGWILAVRRTCSGSVTCKQICNPTFLFTHNNSAWIKLKKWICLESLHVYKNRPVLKDNFVAYTDSYKLGLQVYRYHSCNSSGCGPNYCCCQYN